MLGTQAPGDLWEQVALHTSSLLVRRDEVVDRHVGHRSRMGAGCSAVLAAHVRGNIPRACTPQRATRANDNVSWCFLVLVCVWGGTQCVPSVATRVVAKIYRPIFVSHDHRIP